MGKESSAMKEDQWRAQGKKWWRRLIAAEEGSHERR